MRTLQEIRTKLDENISNRWDSVSRATAFVKYALVVGGSALSGIAQFTQFPPSGTPATWQIVGIGGTLVAALGAIFAFITEERSSEELYNAREAVEKANDIALMFREASDEIGELEKQSVQAVELYRAIDLMRGAIENIEATRQRDPLKIISTMMDVSDRSLPIAMGFAQEHIWTIAVYIAEYNTTIEKRVLRCVAHNRAIECDINSARTWPEGVGVSGVALANRQEAIVPDFTDGALGTLLDLGDRKRPYDYERYRSLVAVPVVVNRDEKPWGVVVATNDRPGHFQVGSQPGIQNAEGARALAGMVALAISVTRSLGKHDASSWSGPNS